MSASMRGPLVIYDCDRPVNTCAAFIFITAGRASAVSRRFVILRDGLESLPYSCGLGTRDLRQKPVYVLNHAQQNSSGMSTMATLDEYQEAVATLADCNTPDSIGFFTFSKYPS